MSDPRMTHENTWIEVDVLGYRDTGQAVVQRLRKVAYVHPDAIHVINEFTYITLALAIQGGLLTEFDYQNLASSNG